MWRIRKARQRARKKLRKTYELINRQ